MRTTKQSTNKKQRSPEDKKRFAALMVIFFTVFIDLIGFGIIIPVLQPYALSYGATNFQAGLLMAVFSIVQFVCAPVWGWLSDRAGRKPVLLLSLLGTSCSYVILGLADSLLLLFVGRIFAGLFSGNIAVAQAYIADVTPPEKRAHGMGMIGAAFGLGFICGPVVGGLLSQISFSLPAYAAAGASFLAFLWGLTRLHESLPPEKRSKTGGIRYPVFNILKVYKEKDVSAVIFANFLWVTTFSMWETIFVLFVGVVVITGVSEKELAKQVGIMFALMGLLSAFIQGWLIRKLTHRFTEEHLAQSGVALFILGSVAFMAVPFLGVKGLLWLFPGLVLVAVGQGLANPTLSAIISKLVSPERQGEVLGSFRGMGSLGRALGPALGAFLFGKVSPLAPYFAGILLLLGSLYYLMREFEFYQQPAEQPGKA